jgi:hypothetical protein
MKNKLKRTEFFCWLIACGLGTLLHFVYEWTGKNPLVGLFCPVNESTWEHLKLLFYPIMVVSIPEYLILRKQGNVFLCTKFLSALLGMGLTVVMFYTYVGVYGKNVDALNIILYFIAMAVAYIFSCHRLENWNSCTVSPCICLMGICCMVILFAAFSVYPLPIGLFQPPIL